MLEKQIKIFSKFIEIKDDGNGFKLNFGTQTLEENLELYEMTTLFGFKGFFKFNVRKWFF